MGDGDNLAESELNEKPNGKVKTFLIQPYGSRYYALYEGEDLICVTVYKKGESGGRSPQKRGLRTSPDNHLKGTSP